MTKLQIKLLRFAYQRPRTFLQICKKLQIKDSYDFYDLTSDIEDYYHFAHKEPYELSIFSLSHPGEELVESYKKSFRSALRSWIAIIIAFIALLKSFDQEIILVARLLKQLLR